MPQAIAMQIISQIVQQLVQKILSAVMDAIKQNLSQQQTQQQLQDMMSKEGIHEPQQQLETLGQARDEAFNVGEYGAFGVIENIMANIGGSAQA
jgi:dsRNA-specific ribonuclease